MLEFWFSQLPQTGRVIACQTIISINHDANRSGFVNNYPTLKPIAFVREPIPSRRLHYCGIIGHPMAAARHRHFLNSYFVPQSGISKKNFSLISKPFFRSELTFPSSLAMAKMFRWLWQFANFAEKIGGSGLKSAWKRDGAMPRQQSWLWADSLYKTESNCFQLSACEKWREKKLIELLNSHQTEKCIQTNE